MYLSSSFPKAHRNRIASDLWFYVLNQAFSCAETLRCRLDRASSPPRALKLVAAAAAEVREALAGLADSLEGDNRMDERNDSKNRIRPTEEGGKGGREQDNDRNVSEEAAARSQSPTASTLENIMRNCRFLLRCTAPLPSIELAR